MADSKALRDAFIDELRDTYDAEKQLIKALPKMAKAATDRDLRSAFTDHLEETRGHAARLEEIFGFLGEKVRGKHCDGIAGIIEEGKSIMQEAFDDATMDAALVAGGQRAEHYEMAAYGTLVAWARILDLDEVADLLQETLDEEGAADKKLSALAEGGINQRARDASDGDHRDEVEDDTSAPQRRKSGKQPGIVSRIFGLAPEGSAKRTTAKKTPARRANRGRNAPRSRTAKRA